VETVWGRPYCATILEDLSGQAFIPDIFQRPLSKKLSAVKGINRRAFESENPKGNQD
jgi:hypothetical protein